MTLASRIGIDRPRAGNSGELLTAVFLSCLAVVAAGATSVVVARGGGSRMLLVAPVAGFAAVALAILAVRRFEAFVLVILAVRTAVDWTQSAGAAAPRQGSGLPATVLAVAFMAAAAVWLVVRGARIRSAPVRWFLAFLVACAVSSVLSQRPATSFAETARVLAVVTMALVLDQLVRDGASARRVVGACFVASAMPLLVGFHQFATGAGTFQAGGVSRVRGTFIHPNPFAFFLVLLLLLTIALLGAQLPRARSWLYAFGAVAGLALFLTYSRGGWLALVVGFVTIALLSDKRMLLGLAVLVGLLALTPAFRDRVTDLQEERTLRGTAGNSLVWRIDHWRESAQLARANPVTGIGPKVSQFVSDDQRAPHNDPLRVYIEMGVVGLVAYGGLLWSLLATARRALRRAAGAWERAVAVGFAGTLAAFLVGSVGGNLISQVVILWYVVALAAVATWVGTRERGPADA